MELGMGQQSNHSKTQFLGGGKWGQRPLLGRCMAKKARPCKGSIQTDQIWHAKQGQNQGKLNYSGKPAMEVTSGETSQKKKSGNPQSTLKCRRSSRPNSKKDKFNMIPLRTSSDGVRNRQGTLIQRELTATPLSMTNINRSKNGNVCGKENTGQKSQFLFGS